jgi:hypothetical protein
MSPARGIMDRGFRPRRPEERERPLKIDRNLVLVPMTYADYVRFRAYQGRLRDLKEMFDSGGLQRALRRMHGEVRHLVAVLRERGPLHTFDLAAAAGRHPNQVRAAWGAWGHVCRDESIENPFLIGHSYREPPFARWPVALYGVPEEVEPLLDSLHPGLRPAESPPGPRAPQRYTPPAPALADFEADW